MDVNVVVFAFVSVAGEVEDFLEVLRRRVLGVGVRGRGVVPSGAGWWGGGLEGVAGADVTDMLKDVVLEGGRDVACVCQECQVAVDVVVEGGWCAVEVDGSEDGGFVDWVSADPRGGVLERCHDCSFADGGLGAIVHGVWVGG